MIAKYAILMILEYQIKKWNTPPKLLGMVKDLEKSYYLAINVFNIPKNNIYIITDIELKRFEHISPLLDKVFVIDFPCINTIIKTNVKIVKEINCTKSDSIQPEIFVYYSGHGSSVTYSDMKIPSLMLVSNTGKERQYLPNKELINIFYNKYIPVNGIITVPIISRKIVQTILRTSFVYVKKDLFINLNDTTTEFKYEPSNCKILFIYDACHSGNLSGLKFKYTNSEFNIINNTEDIKIPLSVSINSTNDTQDSISSNHGSLFTNQICQILEKKYDLITNLTTLYNIIYKNLNPILITKCLPTICMSENNNDIKLPIF